MRNIVKQNMMQEFVHDHWPRSPVSDEEFALLVQSCQNSFPNLVDMTECGGGSRTVKDVKALLKLLAPSTGIRLSGIRHAVAPLPQKGWEKVTRKAFQQFVQQNHPGARLSVGTGIKSAASIRKQDKVELEISKEGVRICFSVSADEPTWLEHVLKLLDPQAVLVRKEGKVVAESPSGTPFYHLYSRSDGELITLGLQFGLSEIDSAITNYDQICSDPTLRLAKLKGSDAVFFGKTQVKSERFWSLQFGFEPLSCEVPPSDDLRLLQSLSLPSKGGEILVSWSLVNWQSWRLLREINKGRPNDEGGGGALFAFDCPSGKPALFEVSMATSGKFRAAFRFADEKDAEAVYKTLGIKRQNLHFF